MAPVGRRSAMAHAWVMTSPLAHVQVTVEAGLRAREQEVKRVHKMLEDDFTDGKVGSSACWWHKQSYITMSMPATVYSSELTPSVGVGPGRRPSGGQERTAGQREDRRPA